MKGMISMEKEIKELLNKLGIRINVKGYWFWITAIEYKAEHEDANMSKIYCEVAKAHNTTYSIVERALRHAYEYVKEDLQKYFNINYTINNSAFLLLALEDIRKEKN